VCKNEEAWSFDIDTVEPIKVRFLHCQSTYSTEEGNEWEKDRRNKIPNVKIRQTIAQESVWKALLTSFCISRAVTA
jgi:hypothetical protein